MTPSFADVRRGRAYSAELAHKRHTESARLTPGQRDLTKGAEVSEDAVLDEATARALVGKVRGGAEQFAFRHALIRTTLYYNRSWPRRWASPRR
jgi:hypothetical protein